AASSDVEMVASNPDDVFMMALSGTDARSIASRRLLQSDETNKVACHPILVALSDVRKNAGACRKCLGSTWYPEPLAERGVFLLDLLGRVAVCRRADRWAVNKHVDASYGEGADVHQSRCPRQNPRFLSRSSNVSTLKSGVQPSGTTWTGETLAIDPPLRCQHRVPTVLAQWLNPRP